MQRSDGSRVTRTIPGNRQAEVTLLTAGCAGWDHTCEYTFPVVPRVRFTRARTAAARDACPWVGFRPVNSDSDSGSVLLMPPLAMVATHGLNGMVSASLELHCCAKLLDHEDHNTYSRPNSV